MEIVRGIVNSVRQSANISGNQHGFSTSQILTCQIGRQAVEISMEKMPIIQDGDEILVAGATKQGTITAKAYRNFTNGTNGRWSYNFSKSCFTMIIAFLFCGCTVIALPLMFKLMAGGGALAFIFLAGRELIEIVQIQQAYNAVQAGVKATDRAEPGAPPDCGGN